MALMKGRPKDWGQLKARLERERKREPKGPSRIELSERIKELERELQRRKRGRVA